MHETPEKRAPVAETEGQRLLDEAMKQPGVREVLRLQELAARAAAACAPSQSQPQPQLHTYTNTCSAQA